MNNLDKIRELRELTKKWELEDNEVLDKYTDVELAAIYNGIGPEAFPGWLRQFISAMNPTLEPVALIHDIEWHETDHTRDTWHETNNRFQRNGIKAANMKYSWWRIWRYRVHRQAMLFRMACETGAGWKAWNEGDKATEN